MQTVSRPSSSGLSQQSRRIAMFAILLFALSGLISGFALGAFVKPKIPGITPNNGGGITPVAQGTKTATPDVQPRPVAFNDPSIDHYHTIEKNDGTVYTFSAYLANVVGKNGQPVYATDLTCKLWLIQHIDGKLDLSATILANINEIQNPITGTITGEGTPVPEVSGALNFDSTTNQVQACATSGDVTWKYSLSSSVNPGNYELVVLFDWQGKHYNWSWKDIKIK